MGKIYPSLNIHIQVFYYVLKQILLHIAIACADLNSQLHDLILIV